MNRIVRLFIVLALGVGLVGSGCGGATLPNANSASPHYDVAAVRRAAEANPRDAAIARRLAVFEMLTPAGDPARVEAALEHALALDSHDPLTHYLRGVWHSQHGQLDLADEDALLAVQTAQRSRDPLAPLVAEVVAGGLGIDVGDPAVTAQRRAAAESVFADPGNLGPVATGYLGDTLLDDALGRGDAAAAHTVAQAMGCVDRYRVAGPFGPREQLGFDHDFPAAGLGPMADSYDLGPLRGVRPTRDVRAEGCAIWLGGGAVAAAGTTYAEAFIDVPADVDAYVLLSTPNSVVLTVDGAQIARFDRRAGPQPRMTAHRIHLAQGRHEVEVKVASRHPSPIVSVRVVGADGRAPGAGSPAAHGDLAITTDLDPASVYLRTRVLEARGNVVAARDAIAPLFDGSDAAPTVLAAKVSLLFSDPIRPRDRATDEARLALRRLSERDAGNWLPYLELAELAATEGRVDEAIDGLRDASANFPEVIGIGLTLVDLLEQRGFTAEAERRLAGLVETDPSDCSVFAARRRLAQNLHRVVAAAAFAEEQVRCDARSTARLDTLLSTRDWSGASAELDRLESLDLDGDVSGNWPVRVRLARARHDAPAEADYLARIRARWPRADAPVLALVDDQIAAGHSAEAIATLDRAVAEEPASLSGLRSLRGALSLAHDMEPYRLDGLEAIASYRASGARYDAPAVYVLDYAAARIFPDGSYHYLVHQVVEVNSEEALDEVGEFRPQGGELLRVRTIKRDGRIFEPDAIAGLPTLALPRLEVGDFVEYEYVLSQGPSEDLEAGVLSHRFYFQSFEGPLHRTEYLVIAPSGANVHFDRRGPLPEPALETRGDLRLFRYRMDRQPKPEHEPFSVNEREFLPSVSWGIDARWDAFRDTLADQLVDTMQRDPELVRQTEAVISAAHARTDREKAVALFQWVLKNIEGDGSGLFDSAPGMLYDRTGNRDRVFQYMLGLIGIRADLVLVRSAAADQTPTTLPEDGIYDAVALRIALASGPVFATTSQRGVPFGWLPATWLGQTGIVVAEGGETLTLPPRSPVADERRVTIEARLGDDGVAVMRVTETFTGAAAGGWRTDLEQVAAAELQQRFEAAYVAPRFSGAALRSLAIDGMDDPEAPFTLRYEIEGPLAFPDGTDAVISVPLPFEIGAALAATATRRTTALVPQVTTHLSLRVRLPESLGVGTLPPAFALTGPAGSTFQANAILEGDRLVLTRDLELRSSRITPEQFSELARFARTCDREEARPIRLLSR